MAGEGASPGDGFDEVDDRFAQLIMAEFGERSGEAASAPAPSESTPQGPSTGRTELANTDPRPSDDEPSPHQPPTDSSHREDGLPEVFSLDEAWERVEPDDPEPYTPQTLPPMKAPSSAVITSLVLVVGGLVAGLTLGTRQQLAGLNAVLVGIAILGGLAMLMGLALRRRGPEDPDDDGARL